MPVTCTFNEVSKNTTATKIPFVVTLKFEDLTEVSGEIVRCGQCKSYLNLFVEMRDQSFICNLCLSENFVDVQRILLNSKLNINGNSNDLMISNTNMNMTNIMNSNVLDTNNYLEDNSYMNSNLDNINSIDSLLNNNSNILGEGSIPNFNTIDNDNTGMNNKHTHITANINIKPENGIYGVWQKRYPFDPFFNATCNKLQIEQLLLHDYELLAPSLLYKINTDSFYLFAIECTSNAMKNNSFQSVVYCLKNYLGLVFEADIRAKVGFLFYDSLCYLGVKNGFQIVCQFDEIPHLNVDDLFFSKDDINDTKDIETDSKNIIFDSKNTQLNDNTAPATTYVQILDMALEYFSKNTNTVTNVEGAIKVSQKLLERTGGSITIFNTSPVYIKEPSKIKEALHLQKTSIHVFEFPCINTNISDLNFNTSLKFYPNFCTKDLELLISDLKNHLKRNRKHDAICKLRTDKNTAIKKVYTSGMVKNNLIYFTEYIDHPITFELEVDDNAEFVSLQGAMLVTQNGNRKIKILNRVFRVSEFLYNINPVQVAKYLALKCADFDECGKKVDFIGKTMCNIVSSYYKNVDKFGLRVCNSKNSIYSSFVSKLGASTTTANINSNTNPNMNSNTSNFNIIPNTNTNLNMNSNTSNYNIIPNTNNSDYINFNNPNMNSNPTNLNNNTNNLNNNSDYINFNNPKISIQPNSNNIINNLRNLNINTTTNMNTQNDTDNTINVNTLPYHPFNYKNISTFLPPSIMKLLKLANALQKNIAIRNTKQTPKDYRTFYQHLFYSSFYSGYLIYPRMVALHWLFQDAILLLSSDESITNELSSIITNIDNNNNNSDIINNIDLINTNSNLNTDLNTLDKSSIYFKEIHSLSSTTKQKIKKTLKNLTKNIEKYTVKLSLNNIETNGLYFLKSKNTYIFQGIHFNNQVISSTFINSIDSKSDASGRFDITTESNCLGLCLDYLISYVLSNTFFQDEYDPITQLLNNNNSKSDIDISNNDINTTHGNPTTNEKDSLDLGPCFFVQDTGKHSVLKDIFFSNMFEDAINGAESFIDFFKRIENESRA
ncbi:hypothetical protein EDEG_03839 [Edhazardia aedis USNM 41457]|uniref:Zinc finger Sec23/Sec24-type domain-containing protein n=1 Tax=Edhazardia aedis (strain USNM 41457) TaxID=1003232 RepID=J8ZPL6_EDHAE|nr:hypothetical protein EDEG_03839 [Edhazardia aedis USNM 41457]|eukprot:EJW01623.1 hypothetical protein EDEG_03839 [Edhazardia aedis USNM 41457]